MCRMKCTYMYVRAYTFSRTPFYSMSRYLIVEVKTLTIRLPTEPFNFDFHIEKNMKRIKKEHACPI